MPDVLVRQKGEVRIARAKDAEIGMIQRGGSYRNSRPQQGGPACENLHMRATAERASHDHASLKEFIQAKAR